MRWEFTPKAFKHVLVTSSPFLLTNSPCNHSSSSYVCTCLLLCPLFSSSSLSLSLLILLLICYLLFSSSGYVIRGGVPGSGSVLCLVSCSGGNASTTSIHSGGCFSTPVLSVCRTLAQKQIKHTETHTAMFSTTSACSHHSDWNVCVHDIYRSREALANTHLVTMVPAV